MKRCVSIFTGCRKRADGFTFLELLITVALFLFFTTFIMQAFNMGYVSMAELDVVNLAYYLASQKTEQIRNTAYALIDSEPRTPIPGFPDYLSHVEVTFPQLPDTNIKKVVVTVFYALKGMRNNVVLKTQIANF